MLLEEHPDLDWARIYYCIAILHDVFEDTQYTWEEFEKESPDQKIVEALKCLTKIEGEDYDTYMNRVKRNGEAIAIKIKDLKDNLNVSDIPHVLTEKNIARIKKYHKYYLKLKNKHTIHHSSCNIESEIQEDCTDDNINTMLKKIAIDLIEHQTDLSPSDRSVLNKNVWELYE